MYKPATNRQKKVLRFFGIPFSENISVGAAGWEIAALATEPGKWKYWERYLYLTDHYGRDSSELKPFNPEELEATEPPEDWDARAAVIEHQAGIVETFLASNAPFDLPEPDITFRGNTFIFTGKMASGSRKECQERVVALGGIAPAAKSVSRSIDYLVIGEEGSPHWSRGSYGTKIQKAILSRREHGSPAIVSEAHWVKQLERNS